MAEPRPRLRALADAAGIEPSYVSALDQRVVETSDATREALVAAMGLDGSSEAAAARALSGLPVGEVPGPPAAALACTPYPERLGARGGFGIWANLYSLRSDENFGHGDLGDLRVLVGFAAEEGAAFVGLNPLHVLGNRGDDVCPYAPRTRLYRNPLYLRATDVPEFAASNAARARFAALEPRLQALRRAPSLDAAAVEQALFEVLRPLHRDFAGAAAPGRRQAYQDYREGQGEHLERFAAFQALADLHGGDWRRWPAACRTPDGEGVRAVWRDGRAEADFHAWLQFELDSQLQRAAEACRSAGMAIGLYADLALGSAAGGFDTWAHPELFASGVSVGAPPDGFSPSGQDWSFPPASPIALARNGFAYWRRTLEANLRGAGALRIDHALGLRRLFWIPEGSPPSEGAYVRYPERQLLAVLAEVSRGSRALIIGEDLGTVPAGFSQAIQSCGLLSSRVLLFERDADGRFRGADDWPRACLATANTHDLPPLAGWLSGDDLALRRDVGHIADDATRDRLARERDDEVDALRARLVADAHLEPGTRTADATSWHAAITRLLCDTPAALVGVSLDDLACERTPINVPGVGPSRHPSWVRRMRTTVRTLIDDAAVAEVMASVPAARRSPR